MKNMQSKKERKLGKDKLKKQQQNHNEIFA